MSKIDFGYMYPLIFSFNIRTNQHGGTIVCFSYTLRKYDTKERRYKEVASQTLSKSKNTHKEIKEAMELILERAPLVIGYSLYSSAKKLKEFLGDESKLLTPMIDLSTIIADRYGCISFGDALDKYVDDTEDKNGGQLVYDIFSKLMENKFNPTVYINNFGYEYDLSYELPHVNYIKQDEYGEQIVEKYYWEQKKLEVDQMYPRVEAI